MEINMNGAVSINLDRMRGHEIKKYIKFLFVAYGLIIMISLFLPNRINSTDFGKVINTDVNNELEVLQLRQAFKLSSSSGSFTNFEITITNLTASNPTTEKGDDDGIVQKFIGQRHKVAVKILWFETDDDSVVEAYNSNESKYRLEESDIVKLGYTKINTPENVLVEVEGIGYQRVPLLRNTTIGRAKNHLIFMDIDSQQLDTHGNQSLHLESLTFSLDFKSDLFTLCFYIIKLLLAVCSIYTFCRYHWKLKEYRREHLGQVQKWLQFLLLQLVFFNDPFGLLIELMKPQGIPGPGTMVYDIGQSFIESCFISWLLFFWLVFVHSIASKDLVVSMKQFVVPKAILCTLIFLNLITLRLYMFTEFSMDPFFSKQKARQTNDLYAYLSAFAVGLMGLYIMYFIVLTKKALDTIKFFNPAYRVVVGTTIFVMLTCTIILGNNGQASQKIDTILFMSLNGLFNFYLYFMAFLYVPATFVASRNSSKSKQELKDMRNKSESEKEHDDIMKEFYKDELSESSSDDEDILKGV